MIYWTFPLIIARKKKNNNNNKKHTLWVLKGSLLINLMRCFAVAIPTQLLWIEEGRNASVTCQNSFRETAMGLYWITPEGERITNRTRSDKYNLQNFTLVIRNAHKSDLGEYLCILVPADKPQMMLPNLGQSAANGAVERKGTQFAESEWKKHTWL